MIEALVSALPLENSDGVRVIDLGCGAGTVAKRILDKFPHAQMTCLDLAQNMLEMARAKLLNHPNVRYILSDIEIFDFDTQYEAVVSSLALHHLVTGDNKRALYRDAYKHLVPGGVFYNADIVLGSNDFLQSAYMNQWRNFMRRSVTDADIENRWLRKYQEEDHPTVLTEHLGWMGDIGFTEIDVIWKRYNFAVYGGVRR
jgi:tRNA (cmo5U34)-methyltransferase